MTALQDLYPEDFSHCYGCGRLNRHGHHVKSVWKDGEATARFTPEPYHIAMPGFVYGGLIASLIDCHAMATAAGAFMLNAGQKPGVDQTPRFVTGSLQVDYRKPTPAGQELVLAGKAVEVGERKVIVEVSFTANGVETAKGRVIAVRIPDTMKST
jgi:acyl-coenzyme A thioesterase PaaI-like protein